MCVSHPNPAAENGSSYPYTLVSTFPFTMIGVTVSSVAKQLILRISLAATFPIMVVHGKVSECLAHAWCTLNEQEADHPPLT